MSWKEYEIAGHVYATRHCAGIKLGIHEVTLQKIKNLHLDPEDELAVVIQIQYGYQLYGTPFKVDNEWFLSLTHFADRIGISRTSLEYRLNNGEDLLSLYKDYIRKNM